MAVVYNKITLIGLGLIGSSLARAARRDGLCLQITGVARTRETCEKALQLGFVDHVDDDMGAAVADADLVVICTPLSAYQTVARRIGPYLKPGATVTDVGSCKGVVLQEVAPHLPENIHFIPGHPIAGTENSGPEAGFAELFKDRYWILTPQEATDDHAIARLQNFLESLGAMVEIMEAGHHDRVLAITSHLPHIIAYTIVGTAADLENQLAREDVTQSDMVETREVIKFSAGGFRDFTRIAGSDPTMWRDVFLANREASLEMLGRFSEDLAALQRAIRWGDGDKLFDWFTRTRDIRRGIVEQKQAGTFRAVEPETEITDDQT